MLEVATSRLKEEQFLEHTEIVQTLAEDYEPEPETFDAVVSSLAVHYVEDYQLLCKRIYSWLCAGGVFVFTTEHPMSTCLPRGVPRKAEIDGKRRYLVDHYHDEGKRDHFWYVDGVITYHRTMASLVMGLIEAGFNIEEVQEPVMSPEFADHPKCDNSAADRPIFVGFRCRK